MQINNNHWKTNDKYFDMLMLIAKLSNLFSESQIPFIHYRITENLFCKYNNAQNLSRTDTAYDAKIGKLGIGIKTFTFEKDSSIEKIAEFNSLSSKLRTLNGLDLARELANYRNERMEVANRLYGIDSAVYHIIARKKNLLEIFDSPYELVDVNNIRVTKDNDKALHFDDGKNTYNFNRSKSVLMKKFEKPSSNLVKEIPVEILDDPYKLLETLLKSDLQNIATRENEREYVVLPLYSTSGKNKIVPSKSGLNQWNAGGRRRDSDEVYIPVPATIRRNKPNFFPNNKDEIFSLHLPDGTILSAKMCQENLKALMSNPNKALGKWILRDILKISEGTLVTKTMLDKAGFDSLVIYKNSEGDYSVEVSYSESYNDFISR
ncbi:MAG: NgoFVII family restriction endonuclease [Bacteroidales bacterium]|nr:NgoFVII family restriction endonuclease [Bacteroidales bacterium]